MDDWELEIRKSRAEDPLHGVAASLVHDQDIAGREGRKQDLTDIDAEHLRVHRSLNGHAGGLAILPDRPDHGCRPPAAARCAGMETFSPGTASAPPRHVRFGRRFVEEDESRRVESLLEPAPDTARAGDIGAGLFRGPKRLFLYVSPMSTRT